MLDQVFSFFSATKRFLFAPILFFMDAILGYGGVVIDFVGKAIFSLLSFVGRQLWNAATVIPSIVSRSLVSLFPSSMQSTAAFFLHPVVLAIVAPAIIITAISPRTAKNLLLGLVEVATRAFTVVSSMFTSPPVHRAPPYAPPPFVPPPFRPYRAPARPIIFGAGARFSQVDFNDMMDFFPRRGPAVLNPVNPSLELREYLRSFEGKISFSEQFAISNQKFESGHRFLCPITLDVMNQPVKIVEKRLGADGATIESSFYFNHDDLKAWYRNVKKNPLTNKSFNWKDVLPAHDLVAEMNEALEVLAVAPTSESAESLSASRSGESPAVRRSR